MASVAVFVTVCLVGTLLTFAYIAADASTGALLAR